MFEMQGSYTFDLLKFHDFPWFFPWPCEKFHDLRWATITDIVLRQLCQNNNLFDQIVFEIMIQFNQNEQNFLKQNLCETALSLYVAASQASSLLSQLSQLIFNFL